MSSILNALKRLEQERPKRAYPRIWVRRGNDGHGMRRWLGGLFVVLLLVGVAGAAYYRMQAPNRKSVPVSAVRPVQEPIASKGDSRESWRSKLSPKTSATGAGPPATAASIPIATKTSPAVAVPGKPSTERIQPPGPDTAPVHGQSASVGRDALKTPPRDEPTPVLTTKPTEESQSIARQSKRRSSPTNLEKVASDTRPPGGSVTSPTEDPVLPATLLTNTSLKIQAISWSKRPQDRIAVVNSQIVREGETMDGYRVKRINSDDIVLSKEGLDWMLQFVRN